MALQDDINSFSSSNTAIELLVLAACTANTTANRVTTVNTVDDLPDLQTNPGLTGTVVFVNSIGIPVLAMDGCWAGLDRRQLRNDYDVGIIQGWGRNSYGQLGLGFASSALISTPTTVIGTDWLQVSAGANTSVGLKRDYTAWAWGEGSSGSIGDNTSFIPRSSPVSVVGGIADWRTISMRGTHAIGIRANGALWAWGCNGSGRLGDGTTNSRCSPVPVVGGFTDWCQVATAVAGSFSGGVRTDGTLWMWGFNGNGELGAGDNNSRSSPVSVVGGFTDWCTLALGTSHSLAIRTNGTIWAWGYNNSGKLGINTGSGFFCSPLSVVGGFTDWCQAGAGTNHSVAIRSNGTLWAWGSGNFGMIGDNTGNYFRSSPVSVVGGFTDWCQLSAGRDFTLAVRSNGTVWGWGNNSYCQLATSTIPGSNRSSPVQISTGTNWSQVSAGSGTFSQHSLGLRSL